MRFAHWKYLAFAVLTGCEGMNLSRTGSLPDGGGDLDPLGGAGGPSLVIEDATDTFTTRFSQRTDILAVIDNSGSMSQERAAVISSMGEFHQRLNQARTNDYRFAAVTTDAYTNEGKLVAYQGIDIVESSSADPVAAVQGILNSVVNSPKSYWEQGLKAGERALSVNGARLLRANTDLALILISDEEDYSCLDSGGVPTGKVCPGMDTGKQPQDYADPKPWTGVAVESYKNFLKGLGRTVLVYSIVGVADRQCEEVSKGTRYQLLQTLMGTGFTAPICNDTLVDNFTRIGRAISARGDCYALTHPAVNPDSEFVVRVAGVGVPLSSTDGFSYERSSNSICFAGSFIPPAGATLTIGYKWAR